MTQKGAILEIMPVSISQEEFEGTKEVIRSHKSKNTQYKKKTVKKTNNNRHYTTQKTKDKAT